MKGFTKNKYMKTAISFGVGAILLTTAVFANYDNANGYSVCKNAVKDLLFETNFSAEYESTVKLDDVVLNQLEGVYKTNGGGDPLSYNSTKDSSRNGLDGELRTSSYENYQQGDQNINIYTREDGTKESYASKMYHNTYDGVEQKPDGSIVRNRSDRIEKFISFGEKLCDTLVGDLKNSFILSENKDGNRTYNVALTGSQMPDLVSSGASLIISGIKENVESSRRHRQENPEMYQIDGEEYQSTDEILYQSLFSGNEPMIDSVNGTMTINEQDKPILMDGQLRVNGYDESGQAHTLEISLHMNLSDFGTTEIQPVDINTLPNLEMYNRGTTTFVVDTEASEEEQNTVREKADRYAADGMAVIIEDQDGNEIDAINMEEHTYVDAKGNEVIQVTTEATKDVIKAVPAEKTETPEKAEPVEPDEKEADPADPAEASAEPTDVA